MSQDKRVRCTNFTVLEMETLLSLVESYQSIIECKKTDAVTHDQKTKSWIKLTDTFNSMVGTGRSATMLRSKWDALKKTARKEYASYKANLIRTGGGPPPKDLSDLIKKILSIIGVSGTGFSSRFDGDKTLCSNSDEIDNVIIINTEDIECSMAEMSSLEAMGCNNDVDITYDEASKENEEGTSWNSWTPTTLRTPLNPLLQPSSLKDSNTIEHTPTLKRKNMAPLAPSKKPKKANIEYSELVAEKISFIKFQKDLLQKEYDHKKLKLELECEVLKLDLQIKQQQLAQLGSK